VIDHVHCSNRAHVDLALQRLEEHGAHRITVLGLAFKHGTDDLSESPVLELRMRPPAASDGIGRVVSYTPSVMTAEDVQRRVLDTRPRSQSLVLYCLGCTRAEPCFGLPPVARSTLRTSTSRPTGGRDERRREPSPGSEVRCQE
jgi:hypothetical protein